MLSSNFLAKSKCVWSNFTSIAWTDVKSMRFYNKRSGDSDCRRAIVDIPPEGDPVCTEPCIRRKEKKGILHRIKLKVTEGGTNFGTPFRFLQCKKKEIREEEKTPETKALPAPKRKVLTLPTPRAGIQVSILGAESAVGQYLAFLLKQCPCIKKLRLYEAKPVQSECNRQLCNVVEDLRHINTNCKVQAFSYSCCQLECCLQNTDVVVMLDDGGCDMSVSYERRFIEQAPIVKRYADVIANECPKAFIIVCATPVDCMVPLIAESLTECGWYNPRKLLGSLAVPEMRASTLAARALCLEPSYTKVPCVAGAEGESLVPLFSKAVEYFDFTRCNAEMLTNTVRAASTAVSRTDGDCMRTAELSEAHAVAGLVTKVSNALLCKDVPRVTGFVEIEPGKIICSTRFLANTVEIQGSGITKNFGLPKMSDTEVTLVNLALNELCYKQKMVADWYCKYCSSSCRLDNCQLHFFNPKHFQRFDDCAYANI